MRFDVSSTALLSRLQSISKVIASKNSLPILDSFLFNLEGNTLTVIASDAESPVGDFRRRHECPRCRTLCRFPPRYCSIR